MSALTYPSNETSLGLIETGKLFPLLQNISTGYLSIHVTRQVTEKHSNGNLGMCAISLKGGLPIRPDEWPIHHPPPEAMEPNAFFSFLSWRQYGEAGESNHPGLESTINWDLEQIAYLSEPQFTHLQKGYDKYLCHRTVVRLNGSLPTTNME